MKYTLSLIPKFLARTPRAVLSTWLLIRFQSPLLWSLMQGLLIVQDQYSFCFSCLLSPCYFFSLFFPQGCFQAVLLTCSFPFPSFPVLLDHWKGRELHVRTKRPQGGEDKGSGKGRRRVREDGPTLDSLTSHTICVCPKHVYCIVTSYWMVWTKTPLLLDFGGSYTVNHWWSSGSARQRLSQCVLV